MDNIIVNDELDKDGYQKFLHFHRMLNIKISFSNPKTTREKIQLDFGVFVVKYLRSAFYCSNSLFTTFSNNSFSIFPISGPGLISNVSITSLPFIFKSLIANGCF